MVWSGIFCSHVGWATGEVKPWGNYHNNHNNLSFGKKKLSMICINYVPRTQKFQNVLAGIFSMFWSHSIVKLFWAILKQNLLISSIHSK